jgi:transposase
VPYLVEGQSATSIIVECFEHFRQQLDKRPYVFLDHAPVHRSQELVEHLAQGVQRGLLITYWPAYAPELNRIELLWRFMTYSWLPFSAYTSFQCLYEAVEQILTRVGTEYTSTFQAV